MPLDVTAARAALIDVNAVKPKIAGWLPDRAEIGIGDHRAVGLREVVVHINDRGDSVLDQHHVIAVAAVVEQLEAATADRD